MKKLVLIFIFIFSLNAFSQKSNNLGFFIGGAYYIGDINPNKHFYNPKISLGFLYRHNFNSRWAVRANVYGGYLSANDIDSKYRYQQIRRTYFETIFIDFAGQMEFNFLPYRLGDEKTPFAPYLALGIGGAYFTESVKPIQLTVPISFGVKFNMSNDIGVGIAWSFRKTFTDYIDNVTNYKTIEEGLEVENKLPMKQFGHFRHYDWYSMVGIFISWRAFNGKGKCKAYQY